MSDQLARDTLGYSHHYEVGEIIDCLKDRRIAIPMRAGVSSLNLASAVAVILYLWRLGRPRAPAPLSPERD